MDLKRQYRGFIPGIILQFYRKRATVFPRFEFYRGHMYSHPSLILLPVPLHFTRFPARDISHLGIISRKEKKRGTYSVGIRFASTRETHR